ncbi:MAG TPA: DNA mismatch repair protein MutS, partial [Firmicutes bacterium]|nr:DNA mismatch repair protein MutS [Bacillota bacterium]
GLVKREIVRVITPGTTVEHALLKDKENNYLLALGVNKQRWGIAVADISTGELSVTEFSGNSGREKAFDEIKRIAPAECLFSESCSEAKYFGSYDGKTLVNYFPAEYFSYEKAAERVLKHFNSSNLAGLGLSGYDGAVCALGALLEYLYENHSNVHYLKKINLYQRDNYLVIDSISRRNLELKASIRDGKKYGTLLWVLDKTVTAMGSRLLRKWIEQPLIDRKEIIKRQDMIEDLINNVSARESLRETLKEVKDMERLISRVNQGTGNARDLLALKNSLKLIPAIKNTLAMSNNFNNILKELFPLEKLVFDLEKALKDDPPLTVREGNMIRNGYSIELDNLRAEIRNSKSWLARLESKERERTGIKSLKIRYNKVFGYYIEITKTNLDAVPDDYIRKQTLVNCERFITQELKEKEEFILRADENIKEMEYEIFLELRRKAAAESEKIYSTAAAIAQIDCLLSLAGVAVENRYVKPVITTDAGIMIEGGRHPVVEQVLDRGLFVDNDIALNNEQRMLILTGPNMAGKSTYLRQAALLTLMAQMGSYIPARKAVIGIVDRIFTRVGAADDLAGGQSTFMVEMKEVANILNNASEKSLIILDEVGRGTSTYDGLSIAWATVEYICNHVKAKTLFATHYHELTALEGKYPEIKNFNIVVKERGDEIVFLRKVVPGGTDKSYGIQVASLA